ncbi:17174_t:CDS:1, partial [Gigaspora margarita]
IEQMLQVKKIKEFIKSENQTLLIAIKELVLFKKITLKPEKVQIYLEMQKNKLANNWSKRNIRRVKL